MADLTYREVLALVHEDLMRTPRGQYALLTERVFELARAKGITDTTLASHQQENIRELVREALWDCLIKQLVVFGSDSLNASWPHYRVTSRGLAMLKEGAPQPYDPDGFIEHFRRTAGDIDDTVIEYVIEAVRAFNASCTRAAAVMLGCASEKLILVLTETFEASIADAAKKAAFKKKLAKRPSISHKYGVLKEHLDRLRGDKDKTKRLPYEQGETVALEMPSGFELIRRCRNAAGHPDVPGDVNSDTVFLNLRAFTEYARRVHLLTRYLETHPVDWS